MSNNLSLSYSFTPINNTTYVKYSNCNTNNYPTAQYNLSSSQQTPILLFTKTPNTNVDKYSSQYGVPFECVEIIRRILSTQCNYTFPSVVDAEDMFYSVNILYNITDNSTTVSLKTYQYPYGFYNENPNKKILLYLKPGSLLFWEKTDDEDFKYGHVAIVVSANNFHVTIAQQNRYPPIQTYKTTELIELINSDDSQFLGIKVIPKNLSEFLSYKLKNIQIKHVDS